jgi:hypothetical protein
MLHRLPKPAEIALFAAMALICATIVVVCPKRDSALFFAAVPLFLVCAMMGFRRNEQNLRTAEVEAEADVEETLV